MYITKQVEKIFSNYNGENAGVKSKLYQILMSGKLAGTGKMVILPVDQGFEHGPARSFAKNTAAYDPHYHFELAIKAGLNAYAAPLGFLEAGADKFAGQIPLILKLNSSNTLASSAELPDQAVTASVRDAVRLGCAAVGLTLYPGSGKAYEMMEEAREIVREAKLAGLAVVIWCYPRGGDLTKEGETAVDVCAYAAHMAALLGANIIKVKPPSTHIFHPEARKVYASEKIAVSDLEQCVRHVVQSCFNGKRLVVFSGGVAKTTQEIYSETRAINNGGGNGSIIGRNSFQRPESEALDLLNSICAIYKD
jgi:class I fructose-bisphosphate aldolase